ncbi:hypothetical protein FQN51_007435 [Onygenales sp. PD_10]|nr:hypothetical protein FQN51_007435 [Onygenales sp. PD_10]
MSTDTLSSSFAARASRFFSSISPLISDYIARFSPNLKILGCSNDILDKLSGASWVYNSWAASLVLIMAGFVFSYRFLNMDGTKRSRAALRKKNSTAPISDGASTEGTDSSVKEKRDVYGRPTASQSDHLKRNGADDMDPGLLKKHSATVSYTTPGATYPSIRTFFCPHPHIEKLPTEPSPLPLLVFIHGLGGSLAQFHPLLTSLVNVAPCFGIDLPGCGLSSFSPKSWTAYSAEALANLLAVAIEQFRDKKRNQKVVLVGHSYGCSLSAMLTSSESPFASSLREHIIGFVAICPPSGPPPTSVVSKYRRMLYIPTPIFDILRWWDRRGGPNSPSVSRFVSENSDLETRKLQLRFNEQSKTPVWRRMAWGTLPTYKNNGEAAGGMPGEKVWAGVRVPLLLIAGESDPITKAEEVNKIIDYLNTGGDRHAQPNSPRTLVEEALAPQTVDTKPHMEGDEWQEIDTNHVLNGSTFSKRCDSAKPETPSKSAKRGIKAFVFPAPASHALLYERNTSRALSGLIRDFFTQYIDHRLSLGWQLQHLTTSGKWDVKNLEKWKAVKPVSDPIGETFVAMKTLREVDEQHTPTKFAQKWKGKIYAVIDISHESPVYDPSQLEKGGIQYHKLPTVSKIPPTVDEVREFVALVDRLKEEISAVSQELPEGAPRPVLGVHCHYGFNRTGFFLTSYLIEKLGFTVQGAIDEFERCRPPGIRHEHFIDTLFVRYCVGLQRASTL